MKYHWIIILGLLFSVSQANAQGNLALKDQKDKVSYIIGMDVGANLKRQEMDINPDILFKGLKDGLSGNKPLLTEKERSDTIAAFQKEMKAKQEEMVKKTGEMNKKEGETFLAGNKKKEGVVTLPSGLQYKVMKQGSGKKPKLTDTVTTHYKGTLIDGTELDSSYRRGQPARLQV